MRKISALILCSCILFALAACGGSGGALDTTDNNASTATSEESTGGENLPDRTGRTSLFLDRNFSKGIAVQGTNIGLTGGNYVGYFDLNGTAQKDERGKLSPIWFVSQFACKNDITVEGTETVNGNTYTYTDVSKTFEVNTETGAIRMGIKGSMEYETPRVYGQSLAGLLFTPNTMKEVMLKDMEALYFELDFVIEQVDIKMSDDEFDVLNHTAQFLFYFFVMDKTNGDWFFLGVPLYDYRQVYHKEYRAQDNPDQAESTGLFIYIPATTECYNYPIFVGEEYSLDLDMLPFFKRGLDYAKKAGYMRNSSYENLYIDGCNIGWEIPGTFDCMATLSHYNVSYK